MFRSKLIQRLLLVLFLSAVMVGTFFLLRWQVAPLLNELQRNGTTSVPDKAVPPNAPTPTATLPSLTQPLVATISSTATRTISTPAPLPTSAAAVVGVVTSAVVNLRSEPSLAGAVVGQVKQGDRLDILATSPDGEWLQVCCPLGTHEGTQPSWVAADFIRAQP